MEEPQTPTLFSKKNRTATLILSLAAFVLCLVMGIQAGSTLHRSTAAQPAAGAMSPSANDEQRTFILALTDGLENPSPELKAIWLVIYRPGTPYVSLVPVYPGAPRLLGEPDYDRHFALDEQHNLDSSFTDLLQKQGIVWNGVILLDQAGLDTLLSDRNPDAAAPTGEDSERIQNLCSQMPALLSSPHWAQTFSSLMPQHLHSDLAFETIVTDWQSLNDPNASLSCDITKP